jgi:hypothetical protein
VAVPANSNTLFASRNIVLAISPSVSAIKSSPPFV